VVLQSDFRDYYDHAFDRIDGNMPYREFRRYSTSGPGRLEMLRTLARHFRAPDFGTVEELASRDHVLVVVYLDPNAHRGDGKRVMPIDQALQECPHCLASQYIYRPGPAQSLRTLQVGRRRFVFHYQSSRNWRSNVGVVEINPWKEIHSQSSFAAAHPLWAVDSILDYQDTEYAVDFNLAPGLAGSGVEQLLSPTEVYQLIKEAL
jgi:hypothetical protein